MIWRHNAEQITTAYFVKYGFTCYFGWIDGNCLMIFLLMKINQFDIKTLIKDCFGLVILRSSKFLKPFLNMISERLFIMSVQYFGIPRASTCVT